jgi:hypothetical protein
MTNEILATLPKDQQAIYQDVPAWVTAAFAIAVFSGSFGALLLLLKKKIASTFFILSFAGIIAQMTYGLLINENSVYASNDYCYRGLFNLVFKKGN